MTELSDELADGLKWLPIVLGLLDDLRMVVGELPQRDADGRILMPASSSLAVAAKLHAGDIGDRLLQAACAADPSLHSAVSVAKLNAQRPDRERLAKALRGTST